MVSWLRPRWQGPGGRQPPLLPGHCGLVPSSLPNRPLRAEALPRQAGPSPCGCRGSSSPGQGSAFGLAERHWAPGGPFLRPGWVPLRGSFALECINWYIQFSVI